MTTWKAHLKDQWIDKRALQDVKCHTFFSDSIIRICTIKRTVLIDIVRNRSLECKVWQIKMWVAEKWQISSNFEINFIFLLFSEYFCLLRFLRLALNPKSSLFRTYKSMMKQHSPYTFAETWRLAPYGQSWWQPHFWSEFLFVQLSSIWPCE